MHFTCVCLIPPTVTSWKVNILIWFSPEADPDRKFQVHMTYLGGKRNTSGEWGGGIGNGKWLTSLSQLLPGTWSLIPRGNPGHGVKHTPQRPTQLSLVFFESCWEWSNSSTLQHTVQEGGVAFCRLGRSSQAKICRHRKAKSRVKGRRDTEGHPKGLL